MLLSFYHHIGGGVAIKTTCGSPLIFSTAAIIDFNTIEVVPYMLLCFSTSKIFFAKLRKKTNMMHKNQKNKSKKTNAVKGNINQNVISDG